MNDAEIAEAVDQILSRYTPPKTTIKATTQLEHCQANKPLDLKTIVSQALAETLKAASTPNDEPRK